MLENIHEAVLRKRMAAEPNAKKKLGVDFRYLMSVLPWSLFRDNNFRGVTRALIAVCVDHHPSLIIPVLNEEALWNATLFWTSEEKRALVFVRQQLRTIILFFSKLVCLTLSKKAAFFEGPSSSCEL